MKTKYVGIREAKAFTLNEMLVLILVLLLFALFLKWVPSENKKNKEIALELCVLPPNTPLDQAPVPMFLERHLGQDWIYARGQSNHPVIIYHPNTVKIISVVKVAVRSPGWFSRDVTARIEVNSDPLVSYTENFLTTPLADADVLFIGVPSEVIVKLKEKADAWRNQKKE